MSKVYGFKIKDVFEFINPEKVIDLGQDYVLDTDSWKVMQKRKDERYRDFWEEKNIAQVILGFVTDDVFLGNKFLEGELSGKELVVYTINMDDFSELLTIYLGITPDMDTFSKKVCDSLRKLAKEELVPNTKETEMKGLEFGFYDVD